MYTDEQVIKQLTRIADALQKLANSNSSSSSQIPCAKEGVLGPNAFLNETEVAQKLGLTKAWLQQKRFAGGGPPYIKMGRKVKYSARELEDWCKSNTVAHTSEWSSKENQKMLEF